MITKFKIFEAEITIHNVDEFAHFYIPVSDDVAYSWWCLKKPVPTPAYYKFPIDWDVIEFGIGDKARDMSEEEIDEWCKQVCWWYDGTRESIEDGLNLYRDFDNSTWSDFVIGLKEKENAEICDFDADQYSFAKDADMLYATFLYDTRKSKFYSEEEFELIYNTKKYNL